MDIIVEKEESPHNQSRVNRCFRKPTASQVILLVLALGYLTLHLSIINQIMLLSEPILIIISVFSGIFAVMIGIDYVLLLWTDPADSYLRKKVVEIGVIERSLLIWCDQCKSYVHRISYHCKQCGICVSELDHHCYFINNCIGSKNYSIFIRLILSLLAQVGLTLTESVWMRFCGNTGWRALILMIVSIPIIPWLVYLIAAHCYSVVKTYKNTLSQRVQEKTQIQNSKVEVVTGNNFTLKRQSANRVVVFPSGQRLKEQSKREKHRVELMNCF